MSGVQGYLFRSIPSMNFSMSLAVRALAAHFYYLLRTGKINWLMCFLVAPRLRREMKNFPESLLSVTKHSSHATSSVDVFIMHRTFLLPNAFIPKNHIRISGVGPGRLQGADSKVFILDSASHLNFTGDLVGVAPSLVRYIGSMHISTGASEPLTLYLSKNSDVPCISGPPPIFPFHVGWVKPVVVPDWWWSLILCIL